VRPPMTRERPADGDGSGAVPGVTISVSELAGELERPNPPVLLDVRWSLAGPSGREGYQRGHLPGARFVDLDRDLAGPPGNGRGRHPLPDAASFQSAMRTAGVSDGSALVVYDAGGGLSAARAWWLLRHHGHRNTRLLDGGLAAWVAADHPLTDDEPAAAAGDFIARPGSMPVLDATDAARLARVGVLLDARAVERYRGEAEPIDPVAGHVPGARSAPTTGNLRPDGTFLAPEALRGRFAELGVEGDAAVGVYCGSGVTAAHEVLALAVAGIPAALYPGSWSEWVSDPSRPVRVGPQPG
jgi:thiosulfate/3-mercaptopyruvate sulfurtransferase